ncbi:HPP family protein [Roseateles sp. DB2]|uniref:HPP family protein n=1 Tax=Roseateles sp. DB2 TaxID=3453717 RepID=UPI003EECA112
MNTANFGARWLARLRALVPALLTAPWRELLLGALGVGLLCTAWISHQALPGQALWFVAPMGASAVLVLSVPGSPLAQPVSIHRIADPLPSRRAGFAKEDVDAALASFGEILDIDRQNLEEILVRAQQHAQRRHGGPSAAPT